MGLAVVPLTAPSIAAARGEFGEDCLRPQAEFRSRPRDARSAGNPEGAESQGSPFLWDLSFGDPKERSLLSGNPRHLNNRAAGAKKNRKTALQTAQQK
ncbi:hypothetical protein GCM10010971_37430 [Silvimonas amylolytica]|uniref:Uncharacterized protein n=1 Tax=Silvimonas amylolytica TaxID=449663 RepID=A0ABQ2PRN1_9NEIS|nr:hypothetical protein GCM10010971_37430 [Silvimonas amylolytica]